MKYLIYNPIFLQRWDYPNTGGEYRVMLTLIFTAIGLLLGYLVLKWIFTLFTGNEEQRKETESSIVGTLGCTISYFGPMAILFLIFYLIFKACN